MENKQRLSGISLTRKSALEEPPPSCVHGELLCQNHDPCKKISIGSFSDVIKGRVDLGNFNLIWCDQLEKGSEQLSYRLDEKQN